MSFVDKLKSVDKSTFIVILEMIKKKWIILVFALFFLSIVMRMNVKESSFDLSPLYTDKNPNNPSTLSLDMVEFETKDFSSIFDNDKPLTINMQGYKFGNYGPVMKQHQHPHQLRHLLQFQHLKHIVN